jgi:serine/threonine protein phosphatase 1
MSKLRPVSSQSCLYVVGDIHGLYYPLHLILSRILPLRKTDGIKDQFVLLGDYIDRNINSHKVIDTLIQIKKDFPDQIITLLGNHEKRFLDAIEASDAIEGPEYYDSLDNYLAWMKNGGSLTLLGYIERAGLHYDSPFAFPRNKIKEIIPKEHVDFLKSLVLYHETQDYIFVHAGCDPYQALANQREHDLMWNRSMYEGLSAYPNAKLNFPKCIVTGHNGEKDGRIFLNEKFMMLDASANSTVYLVELNSKSVYRATSGKKRLVKVKKPKKAKNV